MSDADATPSKHAPTHEQQAVIDTWGRGMAVMAGAGCGKTTTLVNKCLALLARNPEARFAAVSFTERSASDLRTKLSKKLATPTSSDPLGRHWVATIHGLCGSIIREFPREAGFDGEESMLSESESQVLWEQAIESLWLDEIPEDIRALVDTLLSRESRESLAGLLRRVRSLRSFGVQASLAASSDPAAKALEWVSRFVLEKFDRLKRRQGALDFDDLERGADIALNDSKVQRYYQERFALVLVDEFQDTNPVQARILWRFIRPDASNLCVVGDPKQSIYRFRDADVSVFEEFCRKLPVKLSLTWNFRSRPGIIDFTNAACAPAFACSQMDYEPLVPKRPAEGDAVLRLEGADPQRLARWVKQERDRGVPLESMALLLRKIRGNEKWLRALTAEGVPVAVGSGGLFWEDPRVRELVAFLKWWDNPGNALAGAVFLRAPWVGIADRVLDEWRARDPLWVRPFFESDHGLARALLPLRDRCVRPGELLMALLVNEGVERELGAPLLGLWHRVETLSTRGLDFHAVVSELVLAVDESRRERDVPPPRNLGQLSVLTLHGSKGLEFPHVILVDFGEKLKAPETPLLYWDRERGAFLGGRDLEGDRLHRKDTVEKAWKALEDSKNLAESMRLFYVALTRAQERLILCCPPVKDTEFDPETAYGKDHWRAWVECAAAPVLKIEVSLAADPDAPDRVRDADLDRGMSEAGPRRVAGPVSWIRPRHSVTEWNVLSRCPRAYEWSFIRKPQRPAGVATAAGRREDPSTELILNIETGELSQRELGTRVHACLETSDWEGLRELEVQSGGRRFAAEPVIEWARRSESALGREHPDGASEMWSELAFEIKVGGEVVVGALDRLVAIGDGERFRVIDFKVTSSAKTTDDLLERYGTQMRLYALAVQQLVPEARLSGPQANVEAVLVNISPSGVQELKVPPFAPDLLAEAESLGAQAREILAGTAGLPRPCGLCRNCEFLENCPEGQTARRN